VYRRHWQGWIFYILTLDLTSRAGTKGIKKKKVPKYLKLKESKIPTKIWIKKFHSVQKCMDEEKKVTDA
jgi:hypothetical protein